MQAKNAKARVTYLVRCQKCFKCLCDDCERSLICNSHVIIVQRFISLPDLPGRSWTSSCFWIFLLRFITLSLAGILSSFCAESSLVFKFIYWRRTRTSIHTIERLIALPQHVQSHWLMFIVRLPNHSPDPTALPYKTCFHCATVAYTCKIYQRIEYFCIILRSVKIVWVLFFNFSCDYFSNISRSKSKFLIALIFSRFYSCANFEKDLKMPSKCKEKIPQYGFIQNKSIIFFFKY